MDPKTQESNRSTDPALDGLPADQRKETEEIIDEIAKEEKSHEAPPAKPEEAKQKEDDHKKDDKKPDAKADEGGKKPSEDRTQLKIMPKWLHERAKADWEKREKALTDEINSLKGSSSKDKSADANPTPDDVVKSLAEKHGVTEDLVRDLITAANSGKEKLPADLAEQLESMRSMKADQEAREALAVIETDFSKNVLPLIKAEYGDNVPQTVIDEIKEDVKELAVNPDFQKVPLDMLYKGHDDFRGRSVKPTKGAEGGKGSNAGQVEGTREGTDLTKPMSDEEIGKLSDAEFEKYSENMEKLSKEGKL